MNAVIAQADSMSTSDLITLVATCVIAVATGIYTWFSVVLTRETTRLRQLQTDPYVIVRAHHDLERPNILCILIENIGNGIARDVRFHFDNKPPLRAWGLGTQTNPATEEIANGPLVHGIPFLAPRDRRMIDWGQYGGLHAKLGEAPIKVRCEFVDTDGEVHSTACVLEINSFLTTGANRPAHVEATDHLEQISNTLAKLASGFNSISVVVKETESTQPRVGSAHSVVA